MKNIEKDEKQLRTTGQIKNPTSNKYKKSEERLSKGRTEVHQDVMPIEQRIKHNKAMEDVHNKSLIGERALLYLSNPTKILGDVLPKNKIVNFEGTDKDRERVMLNRYNPVTPDKEKLMNTLKFAGEELPSASLNLLMGAAAAETPLGSLVEAYNPIPLPYKKGMKVNPMDLYKDIENISDATDLSKGFEMPAGFDKMKILLEQKKQAMDAEKFLRADLADPETLRRAEALGIDPDILEHATKNLTYTTNPVGSHYSSGDLAINVDPKQIGRMDIGNMSAKQIGSHEVGHLFQTQDYWKNPFSKVLPSNDAKMLRAYKGVMPEEYDKMMELYKGFSTRPTAPTKIDEMLGGLEFHEDLSSWAEKGKNYFENAGGTYGTEVDNMIERLPMFREYRQGMRDAGILENKWDPITRQHMMDYYNVNPDDRLNSIMKFNKKNVDLINQVSKIAPAIVPAAIGLGAMTKEQDGGIIDDNMGQWRHPGRITRISSPDITMKGVDYPVLGISDIGEMKFMRPGGDYSFRGGRQRKVTEFPLMAKDGMTYGLQELDDLRNFTNNNTNQPKGWLDNL
jgi:hypothetical protein